MPKINLLKDTKGERENGEKMEKKSLGFELSEPEKPKREIQGEKSAGGLISFFRTLFPKKPKIIEEKKAPLAEEIEKSEGQKKVTPEIPKFSVSRPAEIPNKEEEKAEQIGKEFRKKLPQKMVPGSISSPYIREEEEKRPVFQDKEIIEDVLEKRDLSEGKEMKEEKSVSGGYVAGEKEKNRIMSRVSAIPFMKKNRQKKEKFSELASPVFSKPDMERGPNLGISLIPEEALEKVEPQKKLFLLAIILSAVIIILGGVWGLLEYQTRNLRKESLIVADKIKTLDEEIKSFETLRKDASLLKNRLDNLKVLLDNHVVWSNFLKNLEKYTLKDVYYTTMSGDINGQFTLSAVALDFKTATEQYQVFQKATGFVEAVNVSSLSKTTITKPVAEGEEAETEILERVSFLITLSINPDILYESNQNK